MSKRQIRKMLRLMAGGEPVELTSPMASVKKLAGLAVVAQQFGYEYADVRQAGGRNTSLVLLILPDPSPQARARAAYNWAQYPAAADGVALPPVAPEALDLLKARINYDLTGKNAEKRLGYGALGVTGGCVVLGIRSSAAGESVVVAVVTWVLLMAVLGVGLVVTRRRHAKFAARLQAAGFTPTTDETGRLRYVPPGTNTFGGGIPVQTAGPYGPYGAAPTAPGGYGHPQPQPGPYGQPGPYAQPQAYPQHYPQPQAQPYPQAPQAPYPPQPPHPYGQAPQR